MISGASTQLTSSLFDFALDAANDRLYVADARNVLVFSNAGTASGNVAPSRTVTTLPGTAQALNGGIYLDTAADRLYAGTNNALGTTQTVQVFDNVSAASFAAPTRSITFTIRNIMDIAVDTTTRDILYVYGSDTNGFTQILVFDNASTLDGAVVPDRTIFIGDSGGAGPVGMSIDAANDRLYVPRNIGTISVFDAVSVADGNVGTIVMPVRTIDMRPFTTGYSVAFVELSANRLYALDFTGINLIANASTASGIPAFTRVIAPSGSVFQAIAVNP